ncbi:MAG: winged helix DNA-binding domain-containing protein [Siphonobacter sp.]
MNQAELLRYRLASQQISSSTYNSPGELARWMGILQAQDYAAGKWSVALRTQGATEKSIEQAISDRTLVRTWSLRGTLHFMAPEDVHWVTDLIRPRLANSLMANHRRQGLSDQEALKGLKLLSQNLTNPHTRTEIRSFLEKQGFSCQESRLNHLLVRAAIEGLICLGPRQEKEFTYTLLEEWIPRVSTKTKEEALAEWAHRYFSSHGPATVQDFAWWAGLTISEAKSGLASVSDSLKNILYDGHVYWMLKEITLAPSDTLFLLPSFDEFLLGYKDRSAALLPAHLPIVVGTGNGLFKPTIMKDGQTIGIWKRTITKKDVLIEASFFAPEHQSLVLPTEQYIQYLRN